MTCDKQGSGGSRHMESVGRMMDSIAEARPSRRAKPSVPADQDMSEPTGLSFAATLIGFVQPPSPQEPPTAASESDEAAGDATLKAGLNASEFMAPSKEIGQSTGSPTEDQAATALALGLKGQTAASQSLLSGLAALGQTQEPMTEGSQLTQLVATANASATQPSPQLPDPSTADQMTAKSGPALDLALATNPQGPSAERMVAAQSAEAKGLKPNGSTEWFANNNVLMASDDAMANSAQNTVSLTTPPQQATAAAGLLPNLAKAATKVEETKIAATDAGGLLAGSNGAADAAGSASIDGAASPIADTTPKPTLVQPHTIPLLAAAMMRRISNGLKEFTLRLDPPELGRVDVRLTVGTDKKVRAVVSTDRPEALKDLALSARELTRALQDAGLELEENGLSFSMNDQSSSHQNRDANQQQSARLKDSLDSYETSEAAKPEQADPLSTHLSGPVERWQRARIAITA
jgi:flagellar hook-length control protein FliK